MSQEKRQSAGRNRGRAVTMEAPATADRTVEDYAGIIQPDRLQHLQAAAAELGNVRVLHINSTASGGGVAELLSSVIPLFNDLGVDSEWRVMDAEESFFDVTKSLHNGLQGQRIALTAEEKRTYRTVTEQNARAISEDYDIVVLHDPQSLGMIELLADRFPDTHFVWRCHIDLTSATQPPLDFITSYVRHVDHAIYSHPTYGQRVNGAASTVIQPSIDPLADKNRSLDQAERTAERNRLRNSGLHDNKPVITQVSRFDPWKDQHGVIEAYRQVTEAFPDVQLVLVGGMADDDPEGAEVFESVVEETGDDSNIHLLTNQPDTTVNFLQRHSEIVLQKSRREGFGLVVAEALWKETPVIGSNVGGIPLQITHGKNGYLMDPNDISAISEKIKHLLADDALRKELGQQGHLTVQDHFLLPRQLRDFIELFNTLRKGHE